MRFADIDAVTLDAYGTLATLVDPVPALTRLLAERGVERAAGDVAAAFAAEAAYYGARASRGRDDSSLALLQRDCAGVFLDAVGVDLLADDFADDYVGALRFELLPGAEAALAGLRARGLELAVVANWDVSLPRRLGELGIGGLFSTVVAAAEKPDPCGLLLALDRLGVEPARALHIGDGDGDEQAASAAGMRFARAPLAAALEGWS